MAIMLGAGGADKAARAVLKRKVKLDEAGNEITQTASQPKQETLPDQKVKDATAGSYKDYQMQQAIEQVRKKKSARRVDY